MYPQSESDKKESGSIASIYQEARIHCAKCKATNPTDAERCQKCGTVLLPGQGTGSRLFFLFLFLLLAGIFAYLMYWNFIRADAPNPDSFWLNPVSLSVGILLSLILAFVLALRRIPIYKRYEKRASRHLNLNLKQSIADLTSALELAPKDAQKDLLKQRRRLYEKIGDSVNADRDRLTLALDPDAWKNEGDFLSVFAGLDGSTFSWSMRRTAIDNLVSSGVAVAVGFCPACKQVVVLDKNKNCPIHPKIKGRGVELVIPADVAAGKLKVLTKFVQKVPSLTTEITNMLEAKEVIALAYCPSCQEITQLDSHQHCPKHTNAKLKEVVYTMPENLETQKRQMLRDRHYAKLNNNRYILVLVSILVLLAISYFVFWK